MDKVAGRPVYKMPFIETATNKEPKPFSWKPNPRFRRKDPPRDSPETQST